MELLKILPETHKYNTLIRSNRVFENFCIKCFKNAKMEEGDLDDVDRQICIILAAKYFFML